MAATKKTGRRGNNQAASGWIKKDRRLAIYLRDRFSCLYCLKDLSSADPRDITLDHIKPESDGGSNHESNLCTASRTCNCRRQDTPLARFAGPETRSHIRRNCKRSLAPYRKLAKALLSGETGFEQTLKTL
jgi:5-methylcytosine-specific restriction endonuclease McrA